MSLLNVLGWGVCGGLVVMGLIGTVVPMLPGTALILAAAGVYDVCLAGPGQGLGWGTWVGLVGLTALSYAVDLGAGMWGAKKYGATRAGMVGGVVGLLVGVVFFSVPGLIVGPPVGVLFGEMCVGKTSGDAARVAWGTVVGAVVGMVVRLGIALGMSGWLGVVIWRALR